MSPDERDAPEKDDDESWTDVGDGAPRRQEVEKVSMGASEAEVEQEEYKVYAGKKRTPPWKLSLYTSVIGLLLMSTILIFPEFRRMATPWNPSYPTAHILLILPLLALLWAVIGLLGAPFRDERNRAWRGFLVAILTLVLGYTVIVTDPARNAQEDIADTDKRLDMTEEELREWRVEKLNR